jgi:hypothetical protein
MIKKSGLVLILEIIVLLLTIGVMGGCSTPYMNDRGRDIADIFTITLGDGVGVTARAGPVHLGLFYGKDQAGLRSGEFDTPPSYVRSEGIARTLDPLLVLPNLGGGPWCFWHEEYSGGLQKVPNPEGGIINLARARAKDYNVSGNCPFIAVPVLSELDRNAGFKYPFYFLTEVEIAIGIGKTLRLGLNPGELLDFILGWTTIDIFGDDIEVRKLKEESNVR